jgi:hypothetical protein
VIQSLQLGTILFLLPRPVSANPYLDIHLSTYASVFGMTSITFFRSAYIPSSPSHLAAWIIFYPPVAGTKANGFNGFYELNYRHAVP